MYFSPSAAAKYVPSEEDVMATQFLVPEPVCSVQVAPLSVEV